MKHEKTLPSETQPNLILTGFMGTGKSSLGRILAERWQRPFLDTDVLIEQHIKISIRDFFAQESEAAFRELERRCVLEWFPATGAVIACGGGLVVGEGMPELLKSKGIVICLFASPDTILKRTAHTTHRPLLNAPNQEERIRELLAQRENSYMRCGTSLLTDGCTFHELAVNIERIYQREVQRRKATKR